ncbi:F-box/FBD/LRR-repeat protein At1g13570-like [Spinacia oleracea]|uniref:F-box/FBD/LRR-repeat protein At1g13570-like n=1 Tax=Spinacia oleracea TaxID=3562 RepID=A0A9R0HW70_SPIOL|nr:F-box/FBD/LRR-repeat protein At1g13570-like [Spinacia oleracea]
MASSNISLNTTDEVNQDLISNLPPIATEKILKFLPIKMAASMSVLSTKWKDNWLSLRHLVFDRTFWEEIMRGSQPPQDNYVAEKTIIIVSNILLHHNGPLQKFLFSVPPRFVLNPPPRDFKGFADLRSLKLDRIECKPDIFGSLIASCPRLTLLKLVHCIGLRHVIINIPSLESLVIIGVLDYLSFKNVASLTYISLLEVYKIPRGKTEVVDSFKDLATSCQLQHLHFGGDQFLATGGVAKSFPLTFNHLSKLCLTELNLGRPDVYRFVFRMIPSCPYIKELEISMALIAYFAFDENALPLQKHEYDDDNFKMRHLLKVIVTDIRGSLAELEFIKYVLAISVMLEKFFFKLYGYFSGDNSKNLVLLNLLQLPRASPKAQLVYLKQ